MILEARKQGTDIVKFYLDKEIVADTGLDTDMVI